LEHFWQDIKIKVVIGNQKFIKNNYPSNSKFKNSMVTKFGNTQGRNKPNYTNSLSCHYCGTPSHIRPNCRQLAQDKVQ